MDQKNLRDKWFFYDENVAIFWDGDKLFQVQNDGKIVDSFTENETIATVEKAEQIFDKDVALSSAERLKEGLFTFEDYRNQIAQIKKMGPLSNVMSMIPGFSKLKNVDLNENEFKWVEAIINSMTKKERDKPEIINGSRRKRIALGSGRTVQEVNRLIKQFNQMKVMIKK